MARQNASNYPATLAHGASILPHVSVDAYNEELKDKDGFIGDRANKGAFTEILDTWRKQIAADGEDPFGERPTSEITKSELDIYLAAGDADAGGLIHTAIEQFALELATVTCRFLQNEHWKGTEHIVVGGGLSGSHFGQVAISRASLLVKERGFTARMTAITNHPDEAGLLGGIELAPSWILDGHDAIVATDIGGTNVRVGIVQFKVKKGEVTKANVWKSSLWRHRDDAPERDQMVERMAKMTCALLEQAKEARLHVAPFFAVGCPGRITADGSIETGAQNLPGDWHARDFSLAHELAEQLPRIRGHEAMFVIHNDAVVQGLSEVRNMRDFEKWGVFTIGTGLGNARFTNR